MKIALVNTSDRTGGAAIACYRLAEALSRTGHEVSMLVKEQIEEPTAKNSFVKRLNNNIWKKWRGKLQFALEKMSFLAYEKDASIRFFFSNPNIGQDISQLREIREADIIHLHWINKGFLSFDSLKKLARLGKPIVWTLHDMWAFTGGCHYSGDCDHYKKSCGNCHFLRQASDLDLSHQIWKKKNSLYPTLNLQIITCSNWLQNIASQSSLFKDLPVYQIPNPIDTQVFQANGPYHKSEKHHILFQAMNINDERKGLVYFLAALELLKRQHPVFARNIKLIVFGKDSSASLDKVDFPIEYLGKLSRESEIIAAYQKSDIFVIPSLQDNLPNTIMESMACGKPVVGFETGGIPEMIDHRQNGYIAAQGDVDELAKGIMWVMEDPIRYQRLAKAAREKVLKEYSYESVSRRYFQVYKDMAKQVQF